MDTFLEYVPMLGLLIGAFFSISPLPALWTALTKDKSALSSISVVGMLMNLSCNTVIYAYCDMYEMHDCVICCGMTIFSCGLTLLVYCSLNNQLLNFVLISVSQVVLRHLIYHQFTPDMTQVTMNILNLLGCVVMPLD